MSYNQIKTTMVPVQAYSALFWYMKSQEFVPYQIGGYYMCNPYKGLMRHYLHTNIFYQN